MAELLVYALLVLLALWALRRLLLARRRRRFDQPHVAFPGRHGTPGTGHEKVLALLEDMQARVASVPRRKQLGELRRLMDEGGDGWPTTNVPRGVRIEAVDIDGLAAEWVIAPRARPERRLLYLHGGAFIVGSPQSHRMMTAELSRRCGVSVLAIDYRLMPENARMDAVVDSQAGLQWMMENGPTGPSVAREVYVAGDSAGGSLALMLAAWARDLGLDSISGVIAFSPTTDSTLTGDTMTANIPTDPMLGPSLGILARLPSGLRAVLVMAGSRTSPRNPLVSPLFGDLSGLPPSLVQASESEMLLDDARRYVDKARAQGSPVTLQTWPGMVHVWPIFHQILPEGRQALDQVASFVASVSDRKSPSAAETANVAEAS